MKKDYSAYRPNVDYKGIANYFSQHPGLAVFLLYSTIAIAGFLYLVSFYNHFNLDVIAYLEITDILVAGIKEPAVLLMVLISFALIFIIWLITYISAPFNAWVDRKCGDGFFSFLPHIIAFKSAKAFWRITFAMLILYFVLFIQVYSKNRAIDVKKLEIDQVMVTSELTSDKNYSLLGTSINYIFLYDRESERNIIIPLENVQAIVPVVEKESKKTENKDN